MTLKALHHQKMANVINVDFFHILSSLFENYLLKFSQRSSYPVPRTILTLDKAKKGKFQITARHISGEGIYNQIKEKTEAKNKETSKKVSLPTRKSNERDCQLLGHVKAQRNSTRLASKIKAKALGNLL